VGPPREERKAGLELSAAAETVQAAGGVVRRPGPDGAPEVLVVHRPRYDDWTLPKGKLQPGETHEQAALREVEEETGLVCELGRELPSTSYRDSRGRPKAVRYWTMRPLSGDFRPNHEVDRVRWLAPEAAAELVTYDRDRDVLRAAAAEA
jgi:8-oxo-dGTP diphosphatase